MLVLLEKDLQQFCWPQCTYLWIDPLKQGAQTGREERCCKGLAHRRSLTHSSSSSSRQAKKGGEGGENIRKTWGKHKKKKKKKKKQTARKPGNCGNVFLTGKKQRLGICGTKAEEAGTHHAARLNRRVKIQGSERLAANCKTMQAQHTQHSGLQGGKAARQASLANVVVVPVIKVSVIAPSRSDAREELESRKGL